MVGNTGFLARLDDVIAAAYAYEVEPKGCLCPNNGGGDCGWCLALSAVRSDPSLLDEWVERPCQESRENGY